MPMKTGHLMPAPTLTPRGEPTQDNCRTDVFFLPGHQRVIGPANTVVEALAIGQTAPDTLNADTNGGGVFKSVGGGSSGTAMNTSRTNTGIHSLAINPIAPDTLYAGTGRGGFFVSTPSADIWRLYLPAMFRCAFARP
jgi:hypothetical protein